ncbi:acyl-CoA synthetase acsm3, mitochondrial [Plakobranchus ocellatus]|uniref:medium-chain acyl-CoA ligase n=1 Tax=Plakobranchus ocellatus TaxID=259542 RepID=A0AAV4D2F1_9GAST|nr:acyl-CoA synthetase acsm3, mitochondrial [Plakobranchus ocellatus]
MAFMAKRLLSTSLRWQTSSNGLARLLFRPQHQHVYGKSLHVTSVRGIELPLSGYEILDYEQERKQFTLQAPEYYNFVRDYLDQWAHAEQNGLRQTKTPAFWWVDTDGKKEMKLSFQDLSAISKRVANALIGGCGLARQDKVIIILPRIPEWWFLHLACIRADITPSSGTMLLRSNDIKHRLKLSKAKCIITTPSMVQYVDEVANQSEDLKTKVVVGSVSETSPGWKNYQQLVENAAADFECVNTKSSDPMMLFFTSGTTGAPKMALHTHSSYGYGHFTTGRYMLQLKPESIVWNLSDTGWAKCAWSSFFVPWIKGACVFIHNAHQFDPVDVLNKLSKYPITHLCSAPTGLRLMVQQKLEDFKFKALYYTIAAGEPLNPELLQMWKRGTGLDIYEGYGQTETTVVCCRPPNLIYKPESTGKSAPGVDVQIVDDDGNIVDRGTEGNISIRCKPVRPVGLFAGYLNEPEKTAASFRGDFYLLGDRGYMDEDDYVYFVGRADDIIISSGYRIGPFEVESALLEHPAVTESAVVSSPDEIRGEVVKAFITLSNEYKESDQEKLSLEIQNFVKSQTAPYKYPRKIEFVKELPKTISGKIRRVELRNKEWNM